MTWVIWRHCRFFRLRCASSQYAITLYSPRLYRDPRTPSWVMVWTYIPVYRYTYPQIKTRQWLREKKSNFFNFGPISEFFFHSTQNHKVAIGLFLTFLASLLGSGVTGGFILTLTFYQLWSQNLVRLRRISKNYVNAGHKMYIVQVSSCKNTTC